MSVHCNVILDLLPLYQDGVCSRESEELITEHLCNCESCRAEFQAIGKAAPIPSIGDVEVEIAKAASAAWKKGKRLAWIKGVAVALVCLILLAAIFVIPYTKSGAGVIVTLWEKQLTEYASDRLEETGVETDNLLGYRVDDYPEPQCVFFGCFGYTGFFYSADGEPVGFQGTEVTFEKYGDGWLWCEKDGDNWMYVEHISGNWYWYEMHF